LFKPPYPTVLKPYGSALVDAALEREEILCLTGDLTRQCEIDLFQEKIPDRFIHCGMAEANMMSLAGALARKGHIPFVHSFGVFATRRPYDQIVNSIAYPRLPVRIVGFMPGLSSPGGPSHQAIEDIAIMRSIPGMTVIDVADATETRRVVPQIVDIEGPVYLRLKRGEIPVVFEEDHQFSLERAQVLREGDAVALIACGMMIPAVLTAAEILRGAGISAAVVNSPVIKPFDAATVLNVARGVSAVVTAENHSVIGGLGSAVAETLATAGLGRPLRRVGLQDTFAEGSKTAPHLFRKYGLTTRDVVAAAWSALGRTDPLPEVPEQPVAVGEYAPV
jgi:transketolase